MNLSQRFHNYLTSQSINEFTTQEARRWYEAHKAQPSKFYFQNLFYLIIKPLMDQSKIRRVFTGHYIVLPLASTDDTVVASTTNESTTLNPIDQDDREDKEFFDYLQQKLKREARGSNINKI